MSFMSYMKNKDAQPRVIIQSDAYEEKLAADVASLLIKPDDRLHEARKSIVNIREMALILSELNYPLADEFMMAIRTGDPKKISHAHMTFRRWANYSKADRRSTDFIETALFHYQTKLYGREFNAEDADKVIKSSLWESRAVLDQMANNIELAASSIPGWKHTIVLVASLPETGWVVTEGRVEVGEAFRLGFKYRQTPNGFVVRGVMDTEGMPPSLVEDFQALIDRLRQNPKINKILTLYMVRPISERRYFEITKRDLSLGLESVLPGHITLTTMPPLGEAPVDVWKVRVEDKYLREFLREGNEKQYHVVGDEAPVKWLELYKKGLKDEE